MNTLKDPHAKADLIEHINTDHPDELLTIARAYGARDTRQARLLDIGEEDCLVECDGSPQRIAFTLEGEVEEKILCLAFEALARQGKPLFGNQKHYFTVAGKTRLTDNILRLHLTTPATIPDEPGYAYYFQLNTLKRMPARKTAAARERLPLPLQWANRLLLHYIKRLNPKKREKMFAKMAEGKRYYTIRAQRAGELLADIYLHGDSAGSRWAQQVKSGDIVMSLGDYRERTPDFSHGQALIIVDESGISTAAAIMERWENPIPPVLIYLTHHEAEQHYPDLAARPADTILHRLRYHTDTQAEIISIISAMDNIHAAWGALESDIAKALRIYLREVRKLPGTQNRIKGYWHADNAKH